jgi:hypothetical protein
MESVILEKHLKLRFIHQRQTLGMMQLLWFNVCRNSFPIYESLSDQLLLYDWLHLHHEDFQGNTVNLWSL